MEHTTEEIVIRAFCEYQAQKFPAEAEKAKAREEAKYVFENMIRLAKSGMSLIWDAAPGVPTAEPLGTIGMIAPSVHNSEPWWFVVGNDYAQTRRRFEITWKSEICLSCDDKKLATHRLCVGWDPAKNMPASDLVCADCYEHCRSQESS